VYWIQILMSVLSRNDIVYIHQVDSVKLKLGCECRMSNCNMPVEGSTAPSIRWNSEWGNCREMRDGSNRGVCVDFDARRIAISSMLTDYRPPSRYSPGTERPVLLHDRWHNPVDVICFRSGCYRPRSSWEWFFSLDGRWRASARNQLWSD